jgi:hypothetical protein
MKEVTIIMAKCQKTKQTFGIRTEKIGQEWHYTWAFPIKEDVAKREGYNSITVKGRIVIDNEYPGCPYCGNNITTQCNCGRIGCNSNNYAGMLYTCPFCNSKFEPVTVEYFDNIKGGRY